MGRGWLLMITTETKSALNCEKHGEYIATTTTTTYSPGSQPHEWTTGCLACEQERIERREREAAEEAKQQRRQRIAVNRKEAGIPVRFAGCIFENYVASTESQKRAVAVALAFAGQFKTVEEAGSNLTFCGAPGCGKTHLACAIGNHLLDSGRTVIYTQAIELVRAIRSTWRRDSNESETCVIAKYRYVDLLILDEIGVSLGGEAEKTQLFDVLNGRYSEMRPSLIISNLNQKGLEECLGPRMFDRLMEKGNMLALFDWGSYRRVAAPKPRAPAPRPHRETDEEMSTRLIREGCERREAERLKKAVVQ
jgi:DNA replication protein DnaC